MDFKEARGLFPVTENVVFLNNAAESPLNLRVKDRLEAYLAVAAENPHKKPPVRDEVRRLLAGLLGGTPDEYALVTSTGVGVGIAASGFRWEEGDNVVVPDGEHWNNAFPWLALRERGVEVRRVPAGGDMRIGADAVAALVDGRTRIVAAAAVRFNSGFRSDLPRLSGIAHAAGALFLVDGIQAAGVMPLNVEADGIDVLCGAGFKWLLGMPGTGFMRVRRAVQDRIRPVLPGMFAAEDDFKELRYHEDARRYETGSIAYSLFHGWTAGLELLVDLGVDRIHGRVLALTDLIISGLARKGIAILSPIETIEERSSILVFSAGDERANRALHERLLRRGIVITLRGGVLRVSPSFFNTEEEIGVFLKAL